MNIAVALGKSSNVKPVAVTFGPDMGPAQRADFYYGYCYGTLDPVLMDEGRFAQMIAEHRLICSVILRHKVPQFVWGLTTEADAEGPYLQFLFSLGAVDVTILRAAVRQTATIARTWMTVNGRYEGVRVWVNGRKGWLRKLRQLGLNIDAAGWVREDDGLFKRRR